MLTPSLQRNLKYTAVIKTHPNSGNRPGANIAFEIPLTAIDSADPYLTERDVLEAPVKGRQAFTYTDRVIRSGMYLVFANVVYAIKGVAPYPEADGFTFYQLLLEELPK